MIKQSRVHIIKRGEGWAVKKEGNQIASRVFKSKTEAVKDSQIYSSRGFDVVVHRADGTIEKWDKAKK